MKNQQLRLTQSAVGVVAAALICALACPPRLHAAPIPGSGYQPPGNHACYRSVPAGPTVGVIGNLSVADPFHGRSWNDLTPLTVAELALHRARYGFIPADVRGGWCNSPGNENKNRLADALQWDCAMNPARIRSVGVAGGLNCIPTSEELTDASTFDEGWPIVWEYEAATGGHVPHCGDGVCDFGEEMSNVAGCISDCHACSNGQPATCATCPSRVPPGVICGTPTTPPVTPPSVTCPVCPTCPALPPPVHCSPLPTLVAISQRSRDACKALLAAVKPGTGAYKQRKDACEPTTMGTDYKPGPPSTARMDLKLSSCPPASTLRECLGADVPAS